MNNILAWLKLIRAGNLAMILFTMFLVRYFIMAPMIEVMNLNLMLPFSTAQFLLLCLSVMLVSAAGYIINDYFDYHIDHVNRPSNVVIGHAISRRQAMFAHSIMNIAGTGLGFYIAYKAGLVSLGFIHLFTTGLLWFYSTDFKKRLLTGNLIVSLLTAIVPLIPVLFELPLFISINKDLLSELNLQMTYVLKFIAGFSVFAFLTTLIREITKDLEDAEGDEEFGCTTLPIAVGEKKSRIIIVFLTVLTSICLAYVQYLQINSGDKASFIYLSLFIQIPLVIFILRNLKHGNPNYYHTSSRLLKGIMLAGISYSFLYSWLILNN
jgi:4-hydroxybenzoate polyprenyltransferase